MVDTQVDIMVEYQRHCLENESHQPWHWNGRVPLGFIVEEFCNFIFYK